MESLPCCEVDIMFFSVENNIKHLIDTLSVNSEGVSIDFLIKKLKEILEVYKQEKT